MSWKLSIWFAAVALVVVILISAGEALAPFFIAAIIAYIGTPLVDKINNIGANRNLAAIFILVIMFAIFIIIPVMVIPLFLHQTFEALQYLPNFIAKIWNWLLANVPGLSQYKETSLRELLANFEFSTQYLSSISTYVTQFITGVLDNIAEVIGFFVLLVVAPFVAFYLMRDWHKIFATSQKYIPRKFRPTIINIAKIFDETLSQFLRAQFIVMLLMAVIYAFLLSIAQTPFAITIGIVAGLLCFIPYAGFAIGLSLAIIVTLLNLETWYHLLYTIIAMVVGTTFESFWLTPKVVGDRSGLGPVSVILSLSVMGALFGFTGLLLAIPVAAIIFALWRHYLVEHPEELMD